MFSTYSHLWLSTLIILTQSQSDYILQTQALSWSDSEQLCLWNYGRHLASVRDTIQNNDANTTRSNNDAWIGLNDIVVEGEFVWSDQTSFGFGSVFYQYPWHSDEPNDVDGEDCVEIGYYSDDDTWNDVSCSSLRYSLCNYPPQYIEIVNDSSNYARIPGKASIATMNVLDVIQIEFDVMFNISAEYVSILNIGNYGNERYPQISFDGQNKQLVFSFTALNGSIKVLQFAENSIALNTSHNIQYLRTQNWLSIQLNNAQIHNASIQSHSILFGKHIYLNANITNLAIYTSNMYEYEANNMQIFNYLCDASNRFSVVKGDWLINDALCTIQQTNVTDENVLWLGDLDKNSLLWSNYKIEAQIELLPGSVNGDKVGIIFRIKSIGQQYFVYLQYYGQSLVLGKYDNGWQQLQSQSVTLVQNKIYALRIEAYLTDISVYLDNTFQFSYGDSLYNYGSVGFATSESSATFHSLRIVFDADTYHSQFPSSAPTFATQNPSETPTFNPSLSPTDPPTFGPSPLPTTAPSNAPTRVPTGNDEYASYFTVEYKLENWVKNDITKLTENAVSVTENICRKIEEGFILDESVIVTYSQFWVQMLSINEIGIAEIDSEYNAELAMQTAMTLYSKTLCDNAECNNLQKFDQSESGAFIPFITKELRQLFGNNELIFYIQSMSVIKQLNPSTNGIDYIFYGVLSMTALIALTALCAFLFNKGLFPVMSCSNAVDDGKYVSLIMFAIQFYDIATDINLAIEIWTANGAQIDDILLFIAEIGSILFVILPYIINVIFVVRVKRIVKESRDCMVWLNDNSAVLTVLVLISGGFYPALAVVSSNCFGHTMTSSGLTQYELKNVVKYKVWGNIILENIPQLLVQAIYCYSIDDVTDAVVSAFVASLLSVVTTVVSYLIDKSVSDTVVIEYYLDTECTRSIDEGSLVKSDSELPSDYETQTDALTDFEEKAIMANKGNTEALSRRISKIFKIPRQNIEIGQSLVQNNGFRTHIVHYILKKDLSDLQEMENKTNDESVDVNPRYFIKRLYQNFEQEINTVFRQHFALNDEFNVKLVKSGISSVCIGGDVQRKIQRHVVLQKMLTINYENKVNEDLFAEQAQIFGGLLKNMSEVDIKNILYERGWDRDVIVAMLSLAEHMKKSIGYIKLNSMNINNEQKALEMGEIELEQLLI